MSETILRFEDVSFSYDSEDAATQPALRNINLAFRRGEFTAVLGHNGSGKSTLAKLMNAILLPDSGRVLVGDMDTADDNALNDIRRTVGMVFQNPDNQIVATIVEDDVAFGPENLGIPSPEIRARVDDALHAVGMQDFRLHEPHKLSGGQKQRVAIAGVIAMQTACIVMDEPTAMLDPRGRAEVMKTVRRLQKELGITVILITHFMDEAVQADRVIVMNEGEIYLDGTPRSIFTRVASLKSVGLEVPQAAELCARLREEGVPLPEDVLSPAECVDAIAAAWGADI